MGMLGLGFVGFGVLREKKSSEVWVLKVRQNFCLFECLCCFLFVICMVDSSIKLQSLKKF